MAMRPTSRDGFEIAVVCALPLEYDAVALAFDEFWDEEDDKYGRAQGDTNTYTTGRIGHYNVVLALLSGMGKVNAASAAASLRSSYTGLRLALLTGICGGVPGLGTENEIILGDVVISKTVVQYDFGRQYTDRFIRKDTVDDNLGRPNKDIRSLLATTQTNLVRERLQLAASLFLDQIQKKAAKKRRSAKYKRPPSSEDKLFKPKYVHMHHERTDCGCGLQVCETARASSCDELHCDIAELERRERLDEMDELERNGTGGDSQEFEIHIGSIASGDTVMKSGADRDRIAQELNVIAFEMEGAGVWDEVPCIVVKGVCDYADSHKNKKWQTYAAATAASVMKALLARYIRTDRDAVDHNSREATTTPSGSQGPIFNGAITGKYVVAGQHTSGGVTNMNFGN
ncbi:phosphorylase superfamily protein [Colletotrichum truncatum]|uniref:Phosphorylase superfamily protein n=1 Tax=Colletotrichum truncatum TaxID=5467 RepID=A0ACC3Z6J7_COLTU|nr:phosphorylase superfamily protein [Colletotrichum truncatum]KAF6788003.1 phosphorylase superfamily protein [Colletotrichum truncatum]